MSWTEERVEQMRVLYVNGTSYREIANVLGVTRNAVISKVHRSCLNTPLRAQQCRTVRAHSVSTPVLSVDDPSHHQTGPVRPADLQFHHCRWPLGDPHDEDFRFCGELRECGSSYCHAHRLKARGERIARTTPSFE